MWARVCCAQENSQKLEEFVPDKIARHTHKEHNISIRLIQEFLSVRKLNTVFHNFRLWYDIYHARDVPKVSATKENYSIIVWTV